MQNIRLMYYCHVFVLGPKRLTLSFNMKEWDYLVIHLSKSYKSLVSWSSNDKLVLEQSYKTNSGIASHSAVLITRGLTSSIRIYLSWKPPSVMKTLKLAYVSALTIQPFLFLAISTYLNTTNYICLQKFLRLFRKLLVPFLFFVYTEIDVPH